MNKSLLFIFLIMNAVFCFGQSDYVPTEKKDKAGYNGKTNINAFDSISNFTEVKLYSDKQNIKLQGKWYDFHYAKYERENFVSHCPLFVDENDAVLEIGIFDKKFHSVFTGYYDYKDFSGDYPRTIKKAKGEIISTQIDKEKNFKLFKIKIPSKFNKEVIFTSYHLIGEKNNAIYRIVIYNIDETNFENFDKFLIDTFNNN
jgi:hypothetical protein